MKLDAKAQLRLELCASYEVDFGLLIVIQSMTERVSRLFSSDRPGLTWATNSTSGNEGSSSLVSTVCSFAGMELEFNGVTASPAAANAVKLPRLGLMVIISHLQFLQPARQEQHPDRDTVQEKLRAGRLLQLRAKSFRLPIGGARSTNEYRTGRHGIDNR